MNVLIIGSGGREHAFAWKLAQSDLVTKIYVAPGNAGTHLENKTENINISVTDISQLRQFAQDNKIDLTLVGPEMPLALGIVDDFQQHNLTIFGPSKACAQLESSKAFSKKFMNEHNIPTAKHDVFTDSQLALDYIKQQTFPIVIKADGLAAGKGVIIASDAQQASTTIAQMLSDNKFGEAGHRIVIEDYLEGIEVSYIAMVDGETILPMASSQDHKARDNNDQGPNTGGMGAYSPAPMLTKQLEKEIIDTVMQPVIDGMTANGTPYSGFLYAGLMLTKQGPKVLEFNCRFGDPETQPIMMRLQSDFAKLCLDATAKRLDQTQLQWEPRTALGVVMASHNYPDSYPKGDVIKGLTKDTHTKVFHAGTHYKEGEVLTNGGRVLCVTALEDTIQSAKSSAYDAVAKIHWGCEFYRTDIGNKAIDFMIKKNFIPT